MSRKTHSAEKEAFWRLALEEYERSGLSVRAYCRQEGLSEPSFYGWRREIRRRDAVERIAEAGEEQGLIPVDVVERLEQPPAEKLASFGEVLTPEGFSFRFPLTIEASRLTVMLQALSRAGRC